MSIIYNGTTIVPEVAIYNGTSIEITMGQMSKYVNYNDILAYINFSEDLLDQYFSGSSAYSGSYNFPKGIFYIKNNTTFCCIS